MDICAHHHPIGVDELRDHFEGKAIGKSPLDEQQSIKVLLVKGGSAAPAPSASSRL
jgi:hypothetical protein